MKKIVLLSILLAFSASSPGWAKMNFGTRTDTVKEGTKAVSETIPPVVEEPKAPAPAAVPVVAVETAAGVPVAAAVKPAEIKVEKEIKAEKKAPEPKKDAAGEERARKAESALKGVENQTAWVHTLEKQLAGEKDKLAKMQDEVAKEYKLDVDKLKKNSYVYDTNAGKFVER